MSVLGNAEAAYVVAIAKSLCAARKCQLEKDANCVAHAVALSRSLHETVIPSGHR